MEKGVDDTGICVMGRRLQKDAQGCACKRHGICLCSVGSRLVTGTCCCCACQAACLLEGPEHSALWGLAWPAIACVKQEKLRPHPLIASWFGSSCDCM